MIRKKNRQIRELTLEVQALRRNVADYRARHDMAVNELSDLSLGLGFTPEYPVTTHVEKMEYKAALVLKKLAKMPLREAP